jgi:transcriptional regulator with XRE-family HTH domain
MPRWSAEVEYSAVTASEDENFSGLLKWLIDNVHPPERGPYSYREIARGVTDLGIPMSSTTVHELASGKRKKATLADAQGLAAFFGYDVDYFTNRDVAARVQEQTAAIKDLQERIARNPGAIDLALRTLNLDNAGREAVDKVISALESHESQDPSQRRRRRRDHDT